MSLLTNLQAATTTTVLLSTGAANSNGTTVDLQAYKGPVTIAAVVGQSVGASNLVSANIQDSADNVAFSDVSGGNFASVTNTANSANVGVQMKSLDVRDLNRYLRCPIVVSGTNVPITIAVIGQKERV